VGGPRHRYLFRGKCRTMERIDAGTISKGGKTVRAIFYRSVHGSLVGYARVPGSDRLAAVTQRRSSYGRDTVDQLFNQTPRASSAPRSSRRDVQLVLREREGVGVLHVGPAAAAPPRGDLRLPTDGSGSYEWTGILRRRSTRRR